MPKVFGDSYNMVDNKCKIHLRCRVKNFITESDKIPSSFQTKGNGSNISFKISFINLNNLLKWAENFDVILSITDRKTYL